jgi:hypothetical protein
MFLFQSAFWTTKSESLAQDLVAAFVKTVLIAVTAFVVMEYAKNVLEVHNKRRALVAFQNKTLESTLSELQSGYTTYFGCTASVGRFQMEDCVTGLKSLRITLDVQSDLVSGILGKELAAFSTLASSIDALVAAHGKELTSKTLGELSGSAKRDLRLAINALAQEIQ